MRKKLDVLKRVWLLWVSFSLALTQLFAVGWFFMRWVLWMRSWYRASFCEKHCICCRLRISWSIRLGVQRYESPLALSSALLPLNTGDWVLDIRPSGHHIHTSHSRSHTQTNTHITHILPKLRLMASSHITHEDLGKRENLVLTQSK